MADEINATDLEQETISTLDGSEQFVMFDSVKGKRATADVISQYATGDKTQLATTDKTSIVGAINEVVGDVSDVKEDLDYVKGFISTITFEVPYNVVVYRNCYIKSGHIIQIQSSYTGNSAWVTIYYADGTKDNGIKIGGDLHFRVYKDVVKIGIYNSDSSTQTFTVNIIDDPLHLTQYYDKSAKESGWISGSNIQTGYYHSDYIPCALNEKFIFDGYPSTFGSVRLYFYDSEKNYMGYRSGTLREDGLYEVTLPFSTIGINWNNGAIYYVRFNMTVAGSDIAVFYIDNVPNTKLEYGEWQPNEHDFFNAQQVLYISNAGSMPISGKKIAYNGDSIAESRVGAGNTYNGGAYAKMIADITAGTYENRAHGGATLASGTSASHKIVSDVTNMADDANLICFEGGINDYWLNVPLGDYTESDYSSTLDTTTLCGALESIFRQAKVKWVGKPIVFVMAHKIKSTAYVSNTAGYTMMQAHEKIIGICKKYAIPVFDAFTESGLNAYDDVQNTNFLTSNASGTADGCHPNADGYKDYYVPQLIDLFNSVMPRN